MTAELTREEAEILIAALTYARMSAQAENNAGMLAALDVLKPWCSGLLLMYVRSLSPKAVHE